MGIDPKTFWQMTVWEWWAAFDEYCAFNGIEFKEAITTDEARDLVNKYAQY